MRLKALCLTVLVISACGGVKAPGGGLEAVTGVVTRIEDKVPVDGGVVIDLRLPGGNDDVIYMPSLFTLPPPPPERQKLYTVIQQVGIGSRVTAKGTRTAAGLEIEELTIINP